MAARPHIPKKPEFQKTASKEPAQVESVLKEIADEEQADEGDEEFLPSSQAASSG